MSRLNQLSYADERLEEMLELLDEIHTAASEDTLNHLVTTPPRDVVNLLREMIYTAQEAISEIETRQPQSATLCETPANIVQFISPEDQTHESRHA